MIKNRNPKPNESFTLSTITPPKLNNYYRGQPPVFPFYFLFLPASQFYPSRILFQWQNSPAKPTIDFHKGGVNHNQLPISDWRLTILG
jgi:hypothetical protein